MKTESQLDLHPDAESLNAFSEQLLPEQERQPILAHLATCARCRQILFLAEDANRDAGSDAAAAQSQADSGPFPLPSANPNRTKPGNWRFGIGALAALAACAALATVSVLLYPRHPGAALQRAANAPIRHTAQTPFAAPAATQAPVKQPLPVAPAVRKGQVQSPKPPASAPEQPSAPRPIPVSEFAVALAAAPAPPQPTGTQPLNPSSTRSLAQSANETVNVTADNTQIDRAQIEPATSPRTATISAAQAESPNPSGNPLRRRASSKTSSGAQATAGKAAGTGDALGSAAGSAAGPIAAAAPKSPAYFAKMPPPPLIVTPEDQSAALRTLHKTLPSGLPAIAATSASHRLLAIDSAGSLFLSEDAGIVWEPVPPRWPGRAADVRLAGAAIAPASVQSVQRPPSQPPAPSSFELVTEDGLRWTSSDGRKWERDSKRK